MFYSILYFIQFSYLSRFLLILHSSFYHLFYFLSQIWNLRWFHSHYQNQNYNQNSPFQCHSSNLYLFQFCFSFLSLFHFLFLIHFHFHSIYPHLFLSLFLILLFKSMFLLLNQSLFHYHIHLSLTSIQVISINLIPLLSFVHSIHLKFYYFPLFLHLSIIYLQFSNCHLINLFPFHSLNQFQSLYLHFIIISLFPSLLIFHIIFIILIVIIFLFLFLFHSYLDSIFQVELLWSLKMRFQYLIQEHEHFWGIVMHWMLILMFQTISMHDLVDCIVL